MLHLFASAYGWGPEQVQQLTLAEAEYLTRQIERRDG